MKRSNSSPPTDDRDENSERRRMQIIIDMALEKYRIAIRKIKRKIMVPKMRIKRLHLKNKRLMKRRIIVRTQKRGAWTVLP